MKLVIKEGRYYVTQNGERVGPMTPNGDTEYPWESGEDAYTSTGRWSAARVHPERDLIAEWTEPAVEPDWGDWVTPGEVVLSGDYQYQRINDVSQYRVRKPPPAPVVKIIPVNCYAQSGPYDRTNATVELIDGKPDWTTLKAVQP